VLPEERDPETGAMSAALEARLEQVRDFARCGSQPPNDQEAHQVAPLGKGHPRIGFGPISRRSCGTRPALGHNGVAEGQLRSRG